jgi:ankyrin repeat/BTB/POZ domain-containing protein 1
VLRAGFQVQDLSAEAWVRVVEFMYSDRLSEGLALPLVFEVLDAATRFMLPGLRNLCVAALIEQASLVDPFELYSLAMLYDLPRLENHVMGLFAERLDVVLGEDDFLRLVHESAYSIEKREETDSIPFVDEIRSSILRVHRIEPDEADRKLSLLDAMLEKMSLSG